MPESTSIAAVAADLPETAQPVPHFCARDADIERPGKSDRLLHALLGRATSSISPVSLILAYMDWMLHLSQSPGKWARLLQKSAKKANRLGSYALRSGTRPAPEPCIEPLPQDQRFNDSAWQHWPFNLYYQSFLLTQQWWHNATTGIGGVSPHHEQVVSFMARQLLDSVSPVNFPATNPEVIAATMLEGGQNFVRGASYLTEDYERASKGEPPVGAEAFRPGHEVAVTEGQVVYRNRLIELIQYAPATKEVFAEPVLIVPAWIMKYYILDLSPHNSLVRYLVERGHTVFMISWRNPGESERDLDMADYLQLGIFDAIKAIHAIVPGSRIDAVGYCLGGTLLSIAAAYLARVDRDSLNSMTLLAAQTDFTEAGELTLYMDDSQLNMLDDVMWYQGYLDNRQMAGAFQLLRSNDLIWSRMVQNYLLGKRTPMTDLMAWNADATRMPYCMHSEYLHRLFQRNELATGQYEVRGKPVALTDIRIPIFAVATEKDHVAPWRSVFKIHLLSDTDVSFILTSGGHNAGIVSEPGHRNRRYRIAHWQQGQKYVDPDSWYESTSAVDGSWWPQWAEWLEGHSGSHTGPPKTGAPENGYPSICPAPGTYVTER